MMGPAIVGSIIFQSVGKAVQSFVTSISRPILFLIPVVLILPNFLGLEGVWLAFPISDGLGLLLTLILLIPQMRELTKKHHLTQKAPISY
jgi:Na+-driven multidrug efflux pump